MPFNFSPEQNLEKFIESYKTLGYSTKTAMLNDALRILKIYKAKELRAKRRKEMLGKYADERPEHLLQQIEDEDFE